MASSDATTRRRKLQPKNDPTAGKDVSSSEGEEAQGDDISQTKPSRIRAKLQHEDEGRDSPLLDILRVITFLFFASGALSYLISGGESFFWGMKNPPNYLKVAWWKSKFVCFSVSFLSSKPVSLY